MISTSDFRKGMKLEFRGEPCEIVDFQHVKMGRGGAIIRTKLKGLISGSVFDETFRSGEKFPPPHLEQKQMQYLYAQEGFYYFMDTGTFEQISLDEEKLKEARKFLKENTVITVSYYREAPVSIELPTFVELMVKETDPGFKGDTATGSGKPAVLESGAVVRVPFHINAGDIIKVDTRTSEYIERVK